MKWFHTQTLPPTPKTSCFILINNEWLIPAMLRGSLRGTSEQPVSNVPWIEPFFQIPGQRSFKASIAFSISRWVTAWHVY